MKKTKILFPVAFICVAGFASSLAQASMIGDEVRIRHEYPDVGSIFSGRDTLLTVTSGDSDEITYGGIDIDVEATSILLTRNTSATFATGECNCIIVSEIDNIEIGAVTIFSTFGGLDDSDITFDSSSVTINLSGIGGTLGEVLDLRLTPVPLPAPVLLLSSALAGLVAMRRRRRIAAASGFSHMTAAARADIDRC